jgi:hypothetical protein
MLSSFLLFVFLFFNYRIMVIGDARDVKPSLILRGKLHKEPLNYNAF